MNRKGFYMSKNKAHGPSYTLTLEARLNPSQRKRLLSGEEVARQIENTCKGLLLKHLRGLRGDPKWRKAVDRFKELSEKTRLTDLEKSEKQKLASEIHGLRLQYRLTEYQMHEEAAKVNNHFGRVLSINEAQKAATRAFEAFEKFRKGEAKRLRFKARGEPVTIENKSNEFGLREKNGQLAWKKNFLAPLVVKDDDRYAQLAMQDRTKYVRIFRRTIRGKDRFWVQLIKEGTPPAKNRVFGDDLQPVGMDVGPSAVAVCRAGTDQALIEALLTGGNGREDFRIVQSQKKVSRSLRLTNKNCFDEKGGWLKGAKVVKSKACLRQLAKVADLKRKRASRRKEQTNILANKIVAMGTVIITEDHSIRAWAVRAKQTTVNKKNGKVCRKSRFGRSVESHAPGALRQEIDRRIKTQRSTGMLYAVTRKVKASQLQHDTGTYVKKSLSTRWFTVAGVTVQRDLYSAFLLAHVDPSTLDKVDLAGCMRDWPMYLKAQKAALNRADPKLSVL